MEDQPVASGDLTTDTEVTPTERRRRRGLLRRRSTKAAAASEPPVVDDATPAPRTPVGKRGRRAVEPVEDEPDPSVAETVAAVSGDDDRGDDGGDDDGDEPAKPPVLVPHRPAGKRLMIAAAATAVLFVAAGGFAGAAVQPYLVDRALVHNKTDVARTAAEAVTTLWTYTPEDMESLPDRSANYLAGDFATEYRSYIDAIVPQNKQAQVSNSTEVMGTAVESISPTEATAIVYTNSVATSPVSENIPSLRYLSYRLTLERHQGDWLINRMTAVTQLDLTPQL